MDLLTILVIVLIIVVLFGGYGYRAGWQSNAYAPGAFGVLMVVILVLIVLRLLGRL